MGYIQEFERELRERLDEAKTSFCHDPHEVKDWEHWAVDLTKFVKEKIWESYHNGQKAAKAGAEGKGAEKRTGKPTTEKEEA